MKHKKNILLLGVLAVAFLLPGCGSSEPHEEASAMSR